MQHSNTKTTLAVALVALATFVFASTSYAQFGNLLKDAADRVKKQVEKEASEALPKEKTKQEQEAPQSPANSTPAKTRQNEPSTLATQPPNKNQAGSQANTATEQTSSSNQQAYSVDKSQRDPKQQSDQHKPHVPVKITIGDREYAEGSEIELTVDVKLVKAQFDRSFESQYGKKSEEPGTQWGWVTVEKSEAGNGFMFEIHPRDQTFDLSTGNSRTIVGIEPLNDAKQDVGFIHFHQDDRATIQYRDAVRADIENPRGLIQAAKGISTQKIITPFSWIRGATVAQAYQRFLSATKATEFRTLKVHNRSDNNVESERFFKVRVKYIFADPVLLGWKSNGNAGMALAEPDKPYELEAVTTPIDEMNDLEFRWTKDGSEIAKTKSPILRIEVVGGSPFATYRVQLVKAGELRSELPEIILKPKIKIADSGIQAFGLKFGTDRLFVTEALKSRGYTPTTFQNPGSFRLGTSDLKEHAAVQLVEGVATGTNPELQAIPYYNRAEDKTAFLGFMYGKQLAYAQLDSGKSAKPADIIANIAKRYGPPSFRQTLGTVQQNALTALAEALSGVDHNERTRNLLNNPRKTHIGIFEWSDEGGTCTAIVESAKPIAGKGIELISGTEVPQKTGTLEWTIEGYSRMQAYKNRLTDDRVIADGGYLIVYYRVKSFDEESVQISGSPTLRAGRSEYKRLPDEWAVIQTMALYNDTINQTLSTFVSTTAWNAFEATGGEISKLYKNLNLEQLTPGSTRRFAAIYMVDKNVSADALELVTITKNGRSGAAIRLTSQRRDGTELAFKSSELNMENIRLEESSLRSVIYLSKSVLELADQVEQTKENKRLAEKRREELEKEQKAKRALSDF